MKKIFKATLVLLLITYLSVAEIDFSIPKAKADLNHTQNFPHTKVMMIDYMHSLIEDPVLGPPIKEFMATHYDAIIGGGKDLTSYSDNQSPSFTYTNYYCIYVGNSEYQNAQAWAQSHNVNFEDFFIHYAEPTEACYGSECYILPAGSRVPSYEWYGSGGDLTKTGARVIMNPGNPNYRAWKLDYLQERFTANSNINGVFIDNTTFAGVGIKSPYTIISGGTYQEYPGENRGTDYGDDLVTMFREFKQKFGTNKVQVPNISNYADSQTRIELAYNCTSDPLCPYIWGVYRESLIKSNTQFHFPVDSIQNAENAGVQNLMGGFAPLNSRYQIPYLAEYYLLKRDSTYFFPFLQYYHDGWGIDPRKNQWFEAVSYDIGQPVNDPSEAAKYKKYFSGIDPSSPAKTSMNVTEVTKSGYSYIITDPTKNWVDEQWKGLTAVFPSGYVKTNIYHSGSNWISLYNPEEIPKAGKYYIGNYAYQVLGREFENALVLFKPLPNYLVTETGDLSATTHNLPATSDNPTGRYYSLNSDGTLGPAITSITLRNTDGVILIKESALNQVTLSKTVDKSEAFQGETLTYTIYYSNHLTTTATSVKIEDLVPLGTTYVEDSATDGGTFSAGKVVWDLGSLSAGAAGSVQFKVRIE